MLKMHFLRKKLQNEGIFLRNLIFIVKFNRLNHSLFLTKTNEIIEKYKSGNTEGYKHEC